MHWSAWLQRAGHGHELSASGEASRRRVEEASLAVKGAAADGRARERIAKDRPSATVGRRVPTAIVHGDNVCVCIRVYQAESDTLKGTPKYASKMWFVMTLSKGRPSRSGVEGSCKIAVESSLD